ncbi:MULTISPECIES: hypothetical protein [Pseudomonas]|uniref:hypothetical protein n=1 Tax=Pseudomonas TaxID=286 RepID=UPI000E232913|nr:hypothetical protein [Pseudomonas qingdaonensis]MEC6742535.1 hypothetical protein [Pseudomonas qingdaonensis]
MVGELDERDVARRFCVVCAVIIAAVGLCASLYCLLSPASMFPSLGPVLAIFTLALTNLLCLPLVFAYWLLAFRPHGARVLLVVQGIAMALFALWYGLLLL